MVGVLAAIGACAVSWVPSGALIARWFAERRGSMMGLAFSGMGAGVLRDGSARPVADRRLRLARRLSRPRRGHAGRADPAHRWLGMRDGAGAPRRRA